MCMDWTSCTVAVFRLGPSTARIGVDTDEYGIVRPKSPNRRLKETYEGVFDTGDHWEFLIEGQSVVEPDVASQFQGLWQNLPEGEQARCHTPGFGIEVRDGERLELRAAFCFQCNNISIRTDSSTDMRVFDAGSEPGCGLLQLFKSVV